jgi:hypothetical protein
MPRPRLKFRLSTLLWITLVVASFSAGAKLSEIRLRERIRKAEADASAAIREKNDFIFSQHRDEKLGPATQQYER